MAFTAADFTRIGGSGDHSVFHYVTNDLATAVDDADYFLDVVQQLNLGDIILMTVDLDGTPNAVFGYVSAITKTAGSETVTVTDVA